MDIDDEVEVEKNRIHFRKQFINIISIAGRQWVFIIIPLVLGMIISTAVAFSLPKIYESRTLILVESQKVPESIVKSAVSGTAEDRLSTIKQQVLSRTFLKKIVDDFDLYKPGPPNFLKKKLAKFGIGETKRHGIEGKITRLRKNIVVKTSGRRRLDSFSISYRGRDSVTVMKVTNELASLIMEENLKIREGFVEGAGLFLDGELIKLKTQLEIQEENIGDYKRTHMGALPEQLESNLRALDRYQLRLESLSQAKELGRNQLLDFERELDAEKKKLGVQESTSGGERAIPAIPLSLLLKLNERKEVLRKLLLEYNEEYPDVIMLRQEIMELEERGKSLEGNLDSGITADPQAGSAILTNLKKNINLAKKNLSRIIEKERKAEKNIGILEQHVKNTPRLEQELIILKRDYDKISASYQSLLDKKLNANIFESLEKRQKGEQFRIIDPAITSGMPIKPNKPIIIFMGSAFGFGAGIGLIFIREKLDSTIRQPEEIEKILSTLVLTSIPDTSDGYSGYRRKGARN